MELRQLEYVVGVVDHGGFTRAARALHVAQPSLSQAVRRLEHELGVDLFARVGRGAVLTGAGEAFLGPARQLLRDRDALRAVVAATLGLARGSLHLVALPTLAADPLAPFVGRFRAAHPGVRVWIREPDSGRAVAEAVADGSVDLGLVELPLSRTDLVGVALGVQQLHLVHPPGTPVATTAAPVVELVERPLVVTPPGTSLRGRLDDALAAHGMEAVVAVETGQREAIVPLVVAGAGSALLPGPLARAAAAQGAVVQGLDPPIQRTIGVVHRHGGLSPAARAFLDVARSEPFPG